MFFFFLKPSILMVFFLKFVSFDGTENPISDEGKYICSFLLNTSLNDRSVTLRCVRASRARNVVHSLIPFSESANLLQSAAPKILPAGRSVLVSSFFVLWSGTGSHGLEREQRGESGCTSSLLFSSLLPGSSQLSGDVRRRIRFRFRVICLIEVGSHRS